MYDKCEVTNASISCGAVSLKDELQQQLDRSIKETDRITRLLVLLNANPDVQEILQLIGRRY